MRNYRLRNNRVLFASSLYLSFFLFPFVLSAQDNLRSEPGEAKDKSVLAQTDKLVVETEVGPDQAWEEKTVRSVRGRPFGPPLDRDVTNGHVPRSSTARGASPRHGLKPVASDAASPSPALKLAPEQDQQDQGILINKEHIIQMNRTLRHSIEDNARMTQEKESLETNLGQLRGQREIQSNRMISMETEMDNYKKRLDEIHALEASLGQTVEGFRDKENQKASEFQKQIQELQNALAKSEQRAHELEAQSALASKAPVAPEAAVVAPQVSSPAVKDGAKEVKIRPETRKSLRTEFEAKYQNQIAELKNQLARSQEMVKELEQKSQLAKKQPIPETADQRPSVSVASDATGPARGHGHGQNLRAAKRPRASVEVNLQEEISGARDKSLAIIEMLDKMDTASESLKRDEAKVHYKMGNMFFGQGKYSKAASEYEQAVGLMPKDANAHFNLAFVSGEYLKDQRAALKHYKEYLDLMPNADDASQVKEKIVEAELMIRSRSQSPLEKDWEEHEKRLYGNN